MGGGDIVGVKLGRGVRVGIGVGESVGIGVWDGCAVDVGGTCEAISNKVGVGDAIAGFGRLLICSLSIPAQADSKLASNKNNRIRFINIEFCSLHTIRYD
jgi:hypothetical protein